MKLIQITVLCLLTFNNGYAQLMQLFQDANTHKYESPLMRFIYPTYYNSPSNAIEIIETKYTADLDKNGKPINIHTEWSDYGYRCTLDGNGNLLSSERISDKNIIINKEKYTYDGELLKQKDVIMFYRDSLQKLLFTDTSRINYLYNEKKWCIQETKMNLLSTNTEWSTVYTLYKSYTPEGRLATVDNKDPATQLINFYDKEGNMLSQTMYTLEGDPRQRVTPADNQYTYQYNNKNQCVYRQYAYQTYGGEKCYLTYNKEGLLSEYSMKNYGENFGNDSIYIKLKYNENKLVSETLFSQGDTQYTDTNTYEYDEHNNWAKCTKTNCEQYVNIIERKIKYK
jgi:hypothetical protein